MERNHRFLWGYQIFLALCTAVLALSLAWQAVGIYRAGNGFSAELVRARLAPLALPAGVWVFLVLAGILWKSAALVRMVPQKTEPELLAAALQYGRESSAEIAAIEKKRRIARISCGLICLVSTIPCGLFLGNVENFASWDLETVLADMLKAVGPWLAAAFAAGCVAAVYSRVCAERMTALLRKQPKAEPVPVGEKSLLPARLILAAAAVVLIALGVANGGMRDVLVKAINICTECIGLG